jgi:hypothetical protein
MNGRNLVSGLGIVLLVLVVVSCASTQRSTFRSKTSYDEVWRACLDSLFDIQFSASSADPNTGLIVADQAVVLGRGTVARLNIIVTRLGEHVDVSVNFVPPPGTSGWYGIAEKYVTAVKRRIPDIEVRIPG